MAKQAGLQVIGLLGVLIQAKRQGLIASVQIVMDELRDLAGFHISEPLYQLVLVQVGEKQLRGFQPKICPKIGHREGDETDFAGVSAFGDWAGFGF